jgi:Flp pilus assembly pilin Flp
MSDLTLHTYIRLQIAARSAGQAIIARTQRAGERFHREQTGQDVLEYTGLIVFVAAVVVIMFTMNIPQKVGDAVASAANQIFSQGADKYSAPVVTAP